MKKHKGFSLVELLAVVIILAVLALILIPLVNKMIVSARRGAAIDSAYGYVKAVEYYRANLVETDSEEDDVDTLNPLVHAEGKLPTAGYVIYTARGLNVDVAHLCINDYSVLYMDGRASIATDESYCEFVPDFVEPEGDYIRELCEGTKTFSSTTVYKAKTAEDLACFSKIIKDNTYFTQANVAVVADIDFNNQKNYFYKANDPKATLYGDINGDGTTSDLKTELTTEKGFYPIGRSNTNNKYFRGTIDGNNFTISNLLINRPSEDYVGLFGYNNGTIKKLKINSKVSGNNYVGGLVGYNYNGTVTLIHANSVEVSGTSNIGGLVGYGYGGTVRTSWVTSKVSGTNNIGGVIGYQEYGTTTEIHVLSTEVSGTSRVGGIAGYGARDAYITNSLVKYVKATGGNGALGGMNWVTGTGIIVETGTVVNGVGGCANGCPEDNAYLETLTRTSGNEYKYKLGTKNVNGYDNAIDTWIGGDNDGSGYYFRLDEDGEFQLVSKTDYPIIFDLEGSGTAEDPYLIHNAEEWNTATIKANVAGVNFKIVNDIDFTDKTFYKMGSIHNKFNGVLDGNNKTISGIYSNGGAYTGLVGYAGSSATIKNLTLDNIKFENGYTYEGIVVGYNQTSNIINVLVQNSEIKNSHIAGGIAGYNQATIRNITISNVKINGAERIGGVVGYNNNGTVSLIHANSVEVSGTGNIGGLVGYGYGGTVRTSWVTSKVSGTNNIGGVIGYQEYGTTTEIQVNSTEVSGSSRVGGIAGYGARDAYITNSLVKYVKATGGNGAFGSMNWVTGTGIIVETGTVVNGVGGCANGCPEDNAYLETLTRTSGNEYKYKLGTKNVNGYDNAIDTWIGGDNDGSGYYFRQDSNGEFQLVSTADYPITFNLQGTGTLEDPYLIHNAEEWNTATIKANVAGVNFKIVNDIDFTDKTFYKMGSIHNKFNGVLDGNNKTLSGIYSNGGAYTGLVGYAGSSATIKNLTLDNIKFENGYAYEGIVVGYNQTSNIINVLVQNSEIKNSHIAGGIAGFNQATISNLTVSNVKITGTERIGGVVGYNNNGTITLIHANSTEAVGTNNVGGLVGYVYGGTIRTCWVTSKASGTNNIGGVIGYQEYGSTSEIVVRSTEVSGSSRVGGVVGYGARDAYLSNLLVKNVKATGGSGAFGSMNWITGTNVVVENGNVSGAAVGGCANGCPSTNYYLASVVAGNQHAGKISSSYYNNLTKYDEVLETAYDGDTNNTGYFFGYNTNGVIDLVAENNEPSVTPCTENCPTDDELETVVSTGTGTCESGDVTPPTCTFIRSYPVSNGIGAEFTCTDDSGAPEVASLFNSTTNIVYSYDDILARGSIKTGSVSGNTRSINSRWTTSYAPNQPQPGLCYYYQYGAKDSCGNWTTYTTNSCYYGFSN